MDKKALQEQFEAIAVQNCWNINKYPAGWDGHGDDEYADDFVSGAWWGFQHQQAKVEELQTQLSLQRQRVKAFEEELTSSRNYGDELQKRVDSVTHLIRGLRAEFDLWMDVECPQVERQIELLEQALKGEG
ncbi:hypothetical protein ABTM59_11440 [Acinetobacter baumannii]|uniref:hypothetical protein n=1 Tax=Acinetobacter baumannii TaxID=470 RepID=UPI000B971169|nr:hypothetical protein [Acinetobacter baumannii]MBF6763314.1 hypothetical protein [Acinetobacter baumannii]MBF6945488.1 hypothetical protein [Acinetobacter baumannii]MCC0746494.1 hypothetical protein [Acinetobacter baumannii]OYN91917.1 hypothetical protein CEX94_09870 [Acinetobacter baumannii]TYR48088.1 hypothetical protein FY524_12720 [Acinetobacter baumannii]